MANRLTAETSPYLRQHAHNPVDWYPWGEEAFQKAREEDRPVLLSIGYSSCHWCHVMERESFENEATARLMNDDFVNVKVDREERPDLDHIYMEAVQAMTGQGGWPLTVFLTPAGEPFFGGAYFPPEDMPGLPAFPKVLRTVASAYRSQKGQIEKSARAVRSHLEQTAYQRPPSGALSEDTLKKAYFKLAESFDNRNGGFGGAPKFPQPMVLDFLLRYYHRYREARALEIVEKSLEVMARGGIFDQLGGGFHRYATDAVWLVPHFEKMLYDNALLSGLYLHTYQVTRKPFYRDIVVETLDYVLREMSRAGGGFFSAQDADSGGEEGKHYLWTLEEIETALGPELSALVLDHYGVTREGNYEGKNVLHIARPLAGLAKETGREATALESLLKKARAQLLQARERRVRPGRDEKILAGWNGLMLTCFAEAGRALGEPRYLKAAKESASFLLGELWKDGRLLRTHTGGESKIPAFLEDYASLGSGLLILYETTLDHVWLVPAIKMAATIVEEFWDEAAGVFFDSPKTGESLVVRPRNIFDNAVPCGGSMAAGLLLRLAALTGNDRYTRIATRAMEPMIPYLSEHPVGFGHWLGALDFHLSHPLELVIAGPAGDSRMEALLQVVYDRYLPNKIIAGKDEGAPPELASLPLLETKTMLGGAPTAYLCQAYRCLEPAASPEVLAKQIDALKPGL